MELKKLFSALSVCLFFVTAQAANQLIYTTVTFSANVPSKILLAPVSFISGNVINTNYEIPIGTEAVSIALPVAQWNTTAVEEKNQNEKEVKISMEGGEIIINTPNKYIGGKVNLYTLSGQLVQSSEVGNTGIAFLKTSGCKGLYVLRLSNNANVFSTKILLNPNVDNFSRATLLNNNAIYKATGVDLAIYNASVVSNIVEYNNIAQHHLNLSYNDTIVNYTLEENPTIASFQGLLDLTLYEQLFPNRYGLGRANSPWDPNAAKILSDGDFDFYSYESLMNAIKEISKIRIEVWQRAGVPPYAQKIKWFNKETGETREMLTHPDYNESWNISKTEIKTSDFDYADFCNEGDLATRKRELAAFLANTSHETTGQGSSFAQKTWGLYWIEEVAWQTGSTAIGYVDYGNTTYPPTAGKSYHGRGPIQISYNYNYGQVSEFIFGDKSVLLNNPEKVIEEDFTNDGIPDATLAFQTAIWFWMYPQSPKPSCHDVMVGNWIPTADDISKGRAASKFGMTVNIINGGLECNKGNGDYRVADRIGFYRHYASVFGISVEDYCDCGTMLSW